MIEQIEKLIEEAKIESNLLQVVVNGETDHTDRAFAQLALKQVQAVHEVLSELLAHIKEEGRTTDTLVLMDLLIECDKVISFSRHAKRIVILSRV